MSFISVIAVYFIIWWLVFFAVLPWGVRSHHEDREVTMGQEYGAPDVPMLGRKVVITSLIAALITGGVYLAFAVYGFTLEDLIL
jgi:predicted secreted protein